MACEVWLHISRQVGDSAARSFLSGVSRLVMGVVMEIVSHRLAIPYCKV